ncbi:hypothetical protein [Phenylobacterium sp.]|uniref:hypothetical protein n=1 Tax=Phenylobacterium sp. TaxID=1871053 RepID=UPI0025DF32C2|nr:hypothetical protein [Phenylobacterium sp.]
MVEIPDSERRLLAALAWMAAQYLDREGELDSLSMSAGERAIEELARYGLVDADAIRRSATWTEAGRRFLELN